MSKDNQFRLQINLTKAYKDENGDAFIEGIASGPEVDLTGERMSESALKSMVDSIYKRLIELRDAHKEEWNDDLGEIVELSLTDDNHLFYKAKLDLKLSGARDLWYRLTELKRKLGVSIGGSIVKAGWEYVADLGREVFTYFDVDLYEISITRQAAYQYSFANAVLKSLPKQGAPMTKTETVEKTADLEHQDAGTQNDTNLTESEAAANTDATEEAQEAPQTQSEGEDASQEESEQAAEQSDAETESNQEAESAEGEVEKSTDANGEIEAAGTEATEGNEVAKSAVFGDWAEIRLISGAIEELSWTLQCHVWDVLYDEDKPAQEKLAEIAAGLDDYKSLILKVADALIQNGDAEEVHRAAEAFKTNKPETLAKSLTETTTKADELQKSLDAKTQEVESIQKSLDETKSELEETKKSLAEKETELEKRNGRKAIVFGKFDGVDLAKAAPQQTNESPTMKRWLNS